MDRAKMLTLMKCILEEYSEHYKNLSALVASEDEPGFKAQSVAPQTTAKDCADALSQAIVLLSQPEGVVVPKELAERLLPKVANRVETYSSAIRCLDENRKWEMMPPVEEYRKDWQDLYDALSQKGGS